MNEVGRTIGDSVKPRREKVLPADYPGLPYVGLEHIESQTTRLLGTIPAATMKSAANRFYPGDVLYSRLRPYLNKVWRADREGLCSAEFIVLPGNDALDANFLRYRLNASDFVRFASSLNAGDRPRVDFEQISPFTLPPFSLASQRAAVAEIEKQFTRVDAGVASLRRVQVALKRYRASVLKAGCEGRLSDRSEDPQSLTLEEICESISDGDHQPPPKSEDGIPFLTIGNISAGRLDFSDTRFVPPAYYRAIKHSRRPRRGDLLYSVVGATIGIPVTVDTDAPFCFQRHIAILRPSRHILPRFLWILMANPEFHRDAWRRTTGSAQPTLPLKHLRSMIVRLPPIEEQVRIVAEVDRRISVADYLEANVATNLERSSRLRQAILRQAFSDHHIHPQRTFRSTTPAQAPKAVIEVPMSKNKLANTKKRHFSPLRPLTAHAIRQLLGRKKEPLTLEAAFQSAGLKFIDPDIEEFFGALATGLGTGEIVLHRMDASTVAISAP